ncbi:hypothetical protein GpartN1_g4410.t1 [Galdieria partita]|uniref:Phosphatidate cytidylyltransferase n=1 Tax=Galdieria partita TaxID=83374 RepID=A0A9C7PYR3_9RHOD|nr:hypothetical protein GpartN1_g4410.t1 [Galdieria partita]
MGVSLQTKENKSVSLDAFPKPLGGKWRSFIVRLWTTVAMLSAFFGIISAGHLWVSILIISLETAIFKEVVQLGQVSSSKKELPFFRTLSWCFFFTALYFVYGKAVLANFEDRKLWFMKSYPLRFFFIHHTFVCFSLYCALFVAFVLSLQPSQYAYQFGVFARVHVAILIVVLQAHFMVLNTRQGMIWFLLPVSLVIVNDIFAYLIGFFFGRTKLTCLSPKKTWEGYIGGGIATILFGYCFARILGRYPLMFCPKLDFMDCGFFCHASCKPSPTFISVRKELPQFIRKLLIRLGKQSYASRNLRKVLDTVCSVMGFCIWSQDNNSLDPFLDLLPMQIHSIFLSLFASIIAPFGGFFASGLKRAFKVKDFANLIPGHGGVTDRMDCQLLMGLFTYVYLINFVLRNTPDVGNLMSLVLELSTSEQLELLQELYQLLREKAVPLHVLQNTMNDQVIST